MSKGSLIIPAVAAALIILATPRLATAHSLKGHPDPIDTLVAHERATDFKTGFWSSTELDSDTTGVLITLKRGANGEFSRRGYFESQEMEPGFLFSEVLPSWNIDLPPGTGYVTQLRVRGTTGAWSDWYYVNGFKAVWDIPFKKNTFNAHGKIDEDHWVGNAPAKLVKYRVWLFTVNPGRTPALRRFFMHIRGYPEHNSNYRNPDAPAPGPIAAAGELAPSVMLDVPWRSQSILGREIRGETCCPTSVAMILEKNGRDEITTDVARMVYDFDTKKFGVWPRASQVMSEFGLRAWVHRFRNLDDARRMLATGQPIIASIKAKEGELPEAPYRRTNGHIIVIIGYDESGFIVNDPATSDPKKGRGVYYSNDGMQKAWIDNGGVAIIGHKP